MRNLAALTAAAALVVCAGCDGCGNYGPETIPKDPGTVVVTVVDQSGAGMRDVWVYVHDIPNSVGSTFSRGRATNAAGLAEILAIPAGRRRVEVKPPLGYTAPEIAAVDVVKGQAVSVAFRLGPT
jgi:hypothetical protein